MGNFGKLTLALASLVIVSCQTFEVGKYPIGKNAWVHTQPMYGDKLSNENLFDSWTAGYKSAIAESPAMTSEQKQKASDEFGKFSEGTYYSFWFYEFSLFGKIPAMFGDDLNVTFEAMDSDGRAISSRTFSWIEKKHKGSDITYKYVWVVKLDEAVTKKNLPMDGLYFNVYFPDGSKVIYPAKK